MSPSVFGTLGIGPRSPGLMILAVGALLGLGGTGWAEMDLPCAVPGTGSASLPSLDTQPQPWAPPASGNVLLSSR